MSSNATITLLLAFGALSFAEASSAGDADKVKQFSMEVKSTGSQSIHRHVNQEEALMRRNSDAVEGRTDSQMAGTSRYNGALVQERDREEAQLLNDHTAETEAALNEEAGRNYAGNGYDVGEEQFEEERDTDKQQRDNEYGGGQEEEVVEGEDSDTSDSEEAGNQQVDYADGNPPPPPIQVEGSRTGVQDDDQMVQDQNDISSASSELAKGPGEDRDVEVIDGSKDTEETSITNYDPNGGAVAEGDSQAKAVMTASRAKRRKCSYWQNMGCFLDVMEKSCETDEGAPRDLIKKTTVESAWMCCCPNPYQACDKNQRDATCDQAMNKYVAPHMDKNVKPQTVMTALQKVRGALRSAGGKSCDVLAPEQPISTCGYAQKPKVSRSIGRANLFCEMLSWQMEELGDGNEPEFRTNGCPYNEKYRADQSASMNRKAQSLSDDQIDGA